MHFEQAGDAGRAIEYYVAGAKHALGQYAIQEAYGAFDRAASLIAEEEAAPAAVELSADEANRRRRRRIEVDLGRAEAGYSIRTPEGRSTRSSASSSPPNSSAISSLSDASTRSSPSSGF